MLTKGRLRAQTALTYTSSARIRVLWPILCTMLSIVVDHLGVLDYSVVDSDVGTLILSTSWYPDTSRKLMSIKYICNASVTTYSPPKVSDLFESQSIHEPLATVPIFVHLNQVTDVFGRTILMLPELHSTHGLQYMTCPTS